MSFNTIYVANTKRIRSAT